MTIMVHVIMCVASVCVNKPQCMCLNPYFIELFPNNYSRLQCRECFSQVMCILLFLYNRIINFLTTCTVAAARS